MFTKSGVYLDWASAAPTSPEAERAFVRALRTFGNPSSPHTEGEEAKRLLEESRKIIARLAGVKQEGVIFTSGATEANSLALQGHVKALRAAGRTDIHLLYMPTAHASVVETMQALAEWGVQIEPLVITDGAIDLKKLKEQLRPETALVSVDLVCGETGTRWDVRDVRRVIDAAYKEMQRGRAPQAHGGEHTNPRPLLHVDASQAPFVESFEHTHLGADLITLDAQKVGGVRGIGALIRAHTQIPLEPLLYGGGQEQGLRPGTENPALAAAFAEALKEAHEGREDFNARASRAREQLLTALHKSIPNLFINAGKESVPHILNLSLPNIDTDYLVMLLSEAGFAVSTKSACETNEEGSRAVFALTNDSARVRSTLRISWGPTTKEKDLHNFARELIRARKFINDGMLIY